MYTKTFPRLAFVDLETTGGTAENDRITEIGIIEVDESGVRAWSSLVNPQIPIPAFIQSLTGISDDMVREAPTFAQLADEVAARLQDRIFVAHNARFDYGFLKSEFRRTGHDFGPPRLCTVRLSRKLFPAFARHNLDSLAERHGLQVTERHRALGDAQLIWQFWQKIHETHSVDIIEHTVTKLLSRPSLPPQLAKLDLEEIPFTCGVYLFYGENDLPLFAGKADNLRRRVLSHFNADRASAREQRLREETRRVEWVETSGELGTALQETALIRRLAPVYNRLPAANEEVWAWRLLEDQGRLRASLASPDDLFFSDDSNLYGLFGSPRKAGDALRAIADAHRLCLVALGVEKLRDGKPCSASASGKCSGVCTGGESIASHNARVRSALQGIRLRPWPYAGPIGIRENDSLHVIDGWAYLGSSRAPGQVAALIDKGKPSFDRAVYQILQKWLPKLQGRIVQL